MNEGKWNQLPKDIQEIFMDASNQAWLREVGEIWAASDVSGIDLAVKAGNTHIVLSDQETEVFRKVLEPVVDRWVNEVVDQGIDGRALVARARKLIAKYSM